MKNHLKIKYNETNKILIKKKIKLLKRNSFKKAYKINNLLKMKIYIWLSNN